MSGEVTMRGRIRKVDLGLSLTETSKIIVNKHNRADCVEDGDYIDCIRDFLDDQYIFLNDNLYELVELVELHDLNHTIVLPCDKDGYVEFLTHFYNGGTCLEEMLEEAIK